VLAGRHRHVPLGWGLNCVAPALALAQAIGRIGNWWNQELFGRPTDLPWALEVSDEKAIAAGYPVGTTFHPTFLYESLWNVGLMFVLLWIDRRFRLWPGRLLAFYTLGYGLGRFWIEGLRIDPAKEGGGLRLNQWMALVLIVGSLAFLLIDWARHRGQSAPLPPALQPAVADEPTESVEPIEPVDGADPVTD
jgi:prolipoprotein diacylglyceryl transferase